MSLEEVDGSRTEMSVSTLMEFPEVDTRENEIKSLSKVKLRRKCVR